MNAIPQKLRLYLHCSPKLDFDMRFLPRAGGWLDQDYDTVLRFEIIEQRIRDILNRKSEK